MELSVKNVTETIIQDEEKGETTKFSTTMKNGDEGVTVTVKETNTCSYKMGDKCELKITEKQTTLVPLKGPTPKRGRGRPKKV